MCLGLGEMITRRCMVSKSFVVCRLDEAEMSPVICDSFGV